MNMEGLLQQQPEFMFSNLRFAVKSEEKETKRDKRNKYKGRDYRRLLEKATNRDNKLSRIREQNPEKAELVNNKIAWERAFRRAAGEKVKDDINRLKEGLKRKEKTKMKSKQKWAERKQGEQRRKEMKQQKRNDNIEKRKSNKRKRK